MSKGDNSPGLSKFAAVMRELALKQVPDDLTLDFGEIQSNGALLTNTVSVAIPKSDYLVCRHLKSRSVDTSSAEGHRHSVSTREALKTGDHVLVAWVQEDPVVIDVILDADDVL